MVIKWSQQARADIRNLKAYIAKDSPYYARRFTERMRLFMDSGLLWSAPAKRRGCIEPQLWGIPAALAGNPGSEHYARRGDGAFPWPQHRCWRRMQRQIQSGGGPVFQANAVVTSGIADSGRY